ncbi:hypothetical protein LCGC14_0517210 [marine sediment metagenome]|uniref:Uncharacterized protein n=1 Tax=marine sediment metagenome TaxID=412755 RepID=A0A0F9SI40_9ZZZZ
MIERENCPTCDLNKDYWARQNELIEATRMQRGADRLTKERKQLRLALFNLLHRYIGLVESGDCGHWDVHAEPEVIEAKAALKQR